MRKVKILEKIKAIPNITKVGLLGVMFAYFGGAFLFASTTQWYGTGDSPLHLDYVWQVTQGKLPNFNEGVLYGPLLEVREQPIHYVSQHPPLFYVLLAPFLAPFLENGDWKHAMAVGRAVNIIIGLALGLSLAWAGRTFGGRQKELFTVAVPFIGLLALTVIRNSADVLNDTLGLVWVVCALTLAYKILKSGVSRKNLAMISAILTLGMSTRASYIATLGVVVLAVMAAVYLHSAKDSHIRRIVRASGVAAAVLAPVLVAIGWFYWRNYQASGSWARSGAQSWISDIRPYKSLLDVLTNADLYTAPMKIFHTAYLWGVAAVSFIVGFGSIIHSQWKRLFKGANKTTLVSGGLLAVYVLLVYGMQIDHAVGYGQFSARYFLSLLMPITVVIVYGLVLIEKARGQLVVLFGGLSMYGLVLGIKGFLDTKVSPATYAGLGYVDSFRVAAADNGVPFSLVVMSVIIGLVGFSIVSLSLFKLTPGKFDGKMVLNRGLAKGAIKR